MRIYSQLGDIPFKSFIFPDGQPHVNLEIKETRDEALIATIEAAIRNPQELFEVLLAKDALSASGYRVGLDIRYLMGARMDRRVDSCHPHTLDIVARSILSAGFSKIRVLDAHSEVACRLLGATNVLPRGIAEQIWESLGRPYIVVPDKGAIDRVVSLTPNKGDHIFCLKSRDMATGKLSNPQVNAGGGWIEGNNLLIMDDICDGGGTFSMLAKVLKDRGAKSVNLFVTHGIFSKSLPIEGIDKVYTTDSYTDPYWSTRGPVVIRISMKDLK